MQQPVDHRMHIFVGRDGLLAIYDSGGDSIETFGDLPAFLRGEDARVGKRGRPGLGEADIVRPETKIDADRAIDGIERRVGAAGKAASPKFMRARFFLFLAACGRHTPATISSGVALTAARAMCALESPAASRSLSARTRCASPKSRMKPPASLCS